MPSLPLPSERERDRQRDSQRETERYIETESHIDKETESRGGGVAAHEGRGWDSISGFGLAQDSSVCSSTKDDCWAHLGRARRLWACSLGTLVHRGTGQPFQKIHRAQFSAHYIC